MKRHSRSPPSRGVLLGSHASPPLLSSQGSSQPALSSSNRHLAPSKEKEKEREKEKGKHLGAQTKKSGQGKTGGTQLKASAMSKKKKQDLTKEGGGGGDKISDNESAFASIA